ncbi:mitochondrial import inner membrane translocase subunit Tim9 isoform X2 [Pleurodeles waltl]|uniref:mitochondrial import inner membrane translocase subunit Tim9 isoform X2 n=1 Tax=Pleurodeles waltl TaxID=8319 RepID=UPI00370964FD
MRVPAATTSQEHVFRLCVAFTNETEIKNRAWLCKVWKMSRLNSSKNSLERIISLQKPVFWIALKILQQEMFGKKR